MHEPRSQAIQHARHARTDQVIAMTINDVGNGSNSLTKSPRFVVEVSRIARTAWSPQAQFKTPDITRVNGDRWIEPADAYPRREPRIFDRHGNETDGLSVATWKVHDPDARQDAVTRELWCETGIDDIVCRTGEECDSSEKKAQGPKSTPEHQGKTGDEYNLDEAGYKVNAAKLQCEHACQQAQAGSCHQLNLPFVSLSIVIEAETAANA